MAVQPSLWTANGMAKARDDVPVCVAPLGSAEPYLATPTRVVIHLPADHYVLVLGVDSASVLAVMSVEGLVEHDYTPAAPAADGGDDGPSEDVRICEPQARGFERCGFSVGPPCDDLGGDGFSDPGPEEADDGRFELAPRRDL